MEKVGIADQGHVGRARAFNDAFAAYDVFYAAKAFLSTAVDGDGDRMNIPGVGRGNWLYRMPAKAVSAALAEDLRRLTRAYDR